MVPCPDPTAPGARGSLEKFSAQSLARQVRKSAYYLKMLGISSKHLVIKSHDVILGCIQGENGKRVLFFFFFWLTFIHIQSYLKSLSLANRVFLF